MTALAPGAVVAVTGASGFIGRYLIENLNAEGFRPRTLGRGEGVDCQTDYSRESLRTALQGAGAVVHLAGRRMVRADSPLDLAPFYKPNVAVIGELVEAARAADLRVIVLASTIAVYSDESCLPWSEEGPLRPRNAYGLSKQMAEDYLALLTRTDDLRAVSLRFGTVYGYGEKGTPALMTLANLANAGKTLLLDNPTATIDQIYVRDATASILAALVTEASGVFNIGGGRALTVREIATMVNEVYGNVGNLREVGSDLGELPFFAMNIARAFRDLKWTPRFDLRAGLTEMRDRQYADGAGGA